MLEGCQVIILTKKLYFLSENLFTLTNSVDSDEMQDFILVFTVCKSTHLCVSRI